MKPHPKRSFPNREEIEMDPYSTTILDELIENDEDWKDSDQIIKLTFKAMTDVIKIHGQSIKDIKSILTTRASKTELTTGLSLKANIADVSKTIDQISVQIQDKLSYHDLNNILKEYLHRSEMTKALSQRHLEKQTNSGSKQQTQRDFKDSYKMELQILETRISQFQKEITKQISNCVNLDEFKQALNIIDAKVFFSFKKLNIKDFEDTVQSLVTKPFLSQCLQKKLNKADLQPLLDTKADVQDLEYIVNSLESKVNLATLEKLTQVIENKADKSDIMLLMNERVSLNKSQHRSMIDESAEKFQNLKAELNTEISEIRLKIQALSTTSPEEVSLSKKITAMSTQLHEELHLLKLDQTKSLSALRIESTESINSLKVQIKALNEQLLYRNNTKADTFTRELANQINLRKRCEQKIYEQVDQVRKKIDQLTMKLFEKSQLLNFKSQISEIMERKIQRDHFSKALSQLSTEISAKFQKDNETNTLLLQKLQKTYSEAISTNTTDILKLSKLLSKKQDKFEFSVIEETIRKARKEVEECRKTVDKSYEELQSKLSISEYENDLTEIKKRFDKLFKEIQSKANIKDVCVLADSKPNIDDVNSALKEINEALNQKIAETELQNILKDQSAINETLCSQNIIGRWMWQSGDLRPGSLIPWQIESANTVPQHFFWEKDKTSILILAPGIYEIKACIFSKNSTISVLINGENLDVDKNDQNTNTINRAKSLNQQGKKKSKGKDFCGIKVEHYVMLPARSRVSLCCIGDVGEGFLNIRRF